MSSASTQEAKTDFWGELTLDIDQTAQGTIGGLGVWVGRTTNEWKIARFSSEQDLRSGWNFDGDDADTLNDADVTRLVFEQSPSTVFVSPRLPDRSLVVRPTTEIGVPPAQRVAVFVSVPLWVDLALIETGTNAPSTSIYRQPLERPPDTWFGTTTRAGELCYAGRTNARLNLENVSLPPNRALTKITIDNRSNSTVAFSRLRLPLPHLALYRDADGVLWTEPAVLVTNEGALAQLEVDPRKDWLSDKTKVHSPNAGGDHGLLDRTLGIFFGRSEARLGD